MHLFFSTPVWINELNNSLKNFLTLHDKSQLVSKLRLVKSSEEIKYVKAIKEDIKWLGYLWEKECYASDYFEQLYSWANYLIDNDLAYIDSQSSKEIADQKGTPLIPGAASPYRNRSIKESKDIFLEMAEGKYPEGAHVLRAKVDMSSPNMLLRDPVIYRVLNKPHHRTANKWSIYPMYDWTHGESDYIEQISHSLCTLEFKPHRDLYDWFLKVPSQTLPVKASLDDEFINLRFLNYRKAHLRPEGKP